MKTTVYKANTRGDANHGWLHSKHTFSFAGYYDAERMNFGLLRVVNDDKVAASKGFGTHPHENMEIISIPLSGDLKHKDSMGNTHIIKAGEIQVMSAGTGITHSEYNASDDNDVMFFQIWVYPREKGLKPRYGQKEFDFDTNRNLLTTVVSPNEVNGSLWVYQDVWFNIGNFDKDKSINYAINKKGNGVFAMVVEGEFDVAGTKLSKRDAMGIENIDDFDVKALTSDAQILLIDVPMDF